MMLIMVDRPSASSAASAEPTSSAGETARWVPAIEAARTLGVQERSLYAYVSRGMVRSVPGPSGRQRLYAAEDLQRLRSRRDARSGHGAVAAGALQFGEAVLDSAITEITAAGPSYRGYLVSDLVARGVPFENVAELLWSGALCDGALRWPSAEPIALPVAARPSARAATHAATRTAAKPTSKASKATSKATSKASAARPDLPELPAVCPISDALITATLAFAATDPERGDARPDAMARCGRRLIPQLALACNPDATAADRQRAAGAGSIAAMIAAVWRLPARAIPAIDTALVVIADHELNASTFAARVAAGTGADPYAVVIAALAALSGPRHGTASLAAGRFLAEVGRPAAAAAAVKARRERFQLPPGFGHRAYTGPDPRGAPLFELAERLAPNHPLVRTARAVIAAVAKDDARHAASRASQASQASHASQVSHGREGPPATAAEEDPALAPSGAHPNVDFGQVTLAAALGAPIEATAAWFAVGRAAGWLAHATEQRTTGSLLRPRARYIGPARRPLEYTAAPPRSPGG